MGSLLFHEIQRIPGIMEISGAAAILLALIIWLLRVKKMIFKILLGIVVALYGFIAVNLFAMRLETSYYTDRIEYRQINLFSPRYNVAQVANMTMAELVNFDYRKAPDLGRKGLIYGKMYSSPPNKAVLFRFKDSTYLMLVTDQPDSLLAHVKAYYPFL